MISSELTPAWQNLRAGTTVYPQPVARPRERRSFLFTLGVVIASSVVVLTEPAPFDIAIMLLLIWSLFRDKLLFLGAHRVPAVLLALFALANLISLWEPIDMWRGIWYSAVTTYLMLSMLFISGVISRFGFRGVRAVAVGYGAGGLISVVLGAFAYYVHGPWQSTLLLNGRPKALFKDPNVFGPYLVPIVIYAVAQLVSQKRHRILNAAILLAGAYGVLVSFSRACWLNCILSAAAYFCLRLVSLKSPGQRLALLKRAAVPAVLLVIVALVAVSVPSIQEMLAVRVGNNGLQNYDQERFGAHEHAISTAIAHPLGIGPGQWERWYWMSVHSLYYRLLSENGFDGLIIFVAFLLLSLRRAVYLTFRSPNPEWRNLFCVLTACLLGILLNSSVVDTLHWRHVWLLLGVIWTSQPSPDVSLHSSHAYARTAVSPRPVFGH